MANANTPMKKKLGSKYKAAGVVILILLLITSAVFMAVHLHRQLKAEQINALPAEMRVEKEGVN